MLESILLTLSQLDYFSIIAGNTTLSQTFLKANATSLQRAVDLLNKIDYVRIEQHITIERAFQIFSNSRLAGQSSQCQSALIIITDRAITQESLTAAEVGNNMFASQDTNPVKIFINTFGDPPQGREELRLVCDNSGIWNIVYPDEFNDAVTINRKVISYYKVLAKAITLRDPIWSDEYQGAFGVGLITTVCLPAYDTAINIGRLLGVSCTDVPLSVFQSFPNGTEVHACMCT